MSPSPLHLAEFRGGPLDGRRLEVPLCLPELRISGREPNEPMPPVEELHRYRRTSEMKGEAFVYVWAGRP